MLKLCHEKNSVKEILLCKNYIKKHPFSWKTGSVKFLLLGLTKCQDIVFNAGSYPREIGRHFAKGRTGLRFPHHYSILRLKKVYQKEGNLVRLVELRNPEGKQSKEWTGKWSDKCSSWSTVRTKDKKLNKNKDDGSFWMSWLDFIQYFELLTICQLPSNWKPKNLTEIHGSFIDGNVKNILLQNCVIRTNSYRESLTRQKNSKFYYERLIMHSKHHDNFSDR